MVAFVLYHTGLISLIRYLGRTHAKIVLYHSINDEENNFTKGIAVTVTPSAFVKHLHYIRNHYNIISLEALVNAIKEGNLPSRSLVLTFDDGFMDNYELPYCYLKKHNIPATIFLVTDCIESNRPVWIQELCYLVNVFGTKQFIETLSIVNRKLGNEKPMTWRRTGKGSVAELVKYFAYSLHKDMREYVLDAIFEEYGLERGATFVESNVFLQDEQIEEMKKDGIDFGNHGASHTPFAMMSEEEQREEAVRSKAVIEDRLKKSFVAFAYPFGGERDFTSTSRRIIEESGHSCIVTTVSKRNNLNASVYELGRNPIENVPVYVLALELEKATLKGVIGMRE